MLELKKGTLLLSSFFCANVYEISDPIGTFQDGRAYKVKLCIDQSNYIAVCYDYYAAGDTDDKKMQFIRQICERTYGGQFYGSECIAPVDYAMEGSYSKDARNTLILIYPEYAGYDLQPISELLDESNTGRYMKYLLEAVKKLHEQGFAAGGFNEYNLLLERKSGKLKLVLGANLASGVNGYQEKVQYGKAGDFSEEARGFRKEKLLGIPRYSCWEQLNMVDYAKCADIYSIVTLGFQALIGYHPLQGGLCDGMESDELRQEIYQQNPVFIFGANRKENPFGLWEDEMEAEARWNALPDGLKKLYQEIYAFPNFNKAVARQSAKNMECFSVDCWLKALTLLESK